MQSPLLQCSAFLQADVSSAARYSLPRAASASTSASTSTGTRTVEVSATTVKKRQQPPTRHGQPGRGGSVFKGDDLQTVDVDPRLLIELGVFDGGFVAIESRPVQHSSRTGGAYKAHHSSSIKAEQQQQQQQQQQWQQRQLIHESPIRKIVQVRSDAKNSSSEDADRSISSMKQRVAQGLRRRVRLPPLLAFNLRVHYEGFEARKLVLEAFDNRRWSERLPLEAHSNEAGSRKTMEERDDHVPDDVAGRCTEVEIGRVVHDDFPLTLSYTDALKNFFRKPRLLHEGDIFAVNVSPGKPVATSQRNHHTYSAQLHRGIRTSQVASEFNDTDDEDMAEWTEDDEDSFDGSDHDDCDDDSDAHKRTGFSECLASNPVSSADDAENASIGTNLSLAARVFSSVRAQRLRGRQIAHLKQRVETPPYVVLFQVTRLATEQQESDAGKVRYVAANGLRCGWVSIDWTRLSEGRLQHHQCPTGSCMRHVRQFLNSFVPERSCCHGADRFSATGPMASGYHSRSRPRQFPSPATKVFAPMISRVKRLLRPAFDPAFSHLRQSTPVLLCGPRGSGKRTVVRTVADKLGVNFIEVFGSVIVGCGGLSAPSDSQRAERSPEERIRGIVSRAFEQAPCILYIRHFELACHSSGQTSNEIRGLAAKIADVLSESLMACERRKLGKLGDDSFSPQSAADNTVVLVCGAVDAESLPVETRTVFMHELRMEPLKAPLQRQLFASMLRLNEDNVNGGVKRLESNDVSHGLDFSAAMKLLGSCSVGELCAVAGFAASQAVAAHGDSGHKTIENLQRNVNNESGSSTRAQVGFPDLENAMAVIPTGPTSMVDQPKIPNVRWADIGGLEDAKQDLREMVEMPMARPDFSAHSYDSAAGFVPTVVRKMAENESFAGAETDSSSVEDVDSSSEEDVQVPHSGKDLSSKKKVRGRSGILLYGPPGTGKTLLAKAVATECDVKFLSVKGPELLNMYVGESERNVRQVFQMACDAAPCVLFFDELDSLCPARGNGSDSGGVMDRVVSQFLTELDGIQAAENASVFVIAATNRPDLLDTALLRPGRFDKMVYLGTNVDPSGRLKILQALTRKFSLAADVDLEQIAKASPPTYTGADYYGFCANALLRAVKRRCEDLQDTVDAGDPYADPYSCDAEPLSLQNVLAKLSGEQLQATVTAADFQAAAAEVKPSVSAKELAYYHSLRSQFSAQTST